MAWESTGFPSGAEDDLRVARFPLAATGQQERQSHGFAFEKMPVSGKPDIASNRIRNVVATRADMIADLALHRVIDRGPRVSRQTFCAEQSIHWIALWRP